MTTSSMTRDDRAELDEQARGRLFADDDRPSPTPAEVERQSRDARAFAQLKDDIRRRYPGKRYLHHLNDAEFGELIDLYVDALVAEPHDPDRRALLYAAESGRRTIAGLRRDAATRKAESAKPDQDRLRTEIADLEAMIAANLDTHARLAERFLAAHEMLEKLPAAVPDDRDADEPVVVGHRPS